jgi:hypothetical protein
MIEDMALLKKAMEQMDAEDPVVAQAAKDRVAQTLSDAKLNFSKMAELIEQRRLLLRPRIVATIKRMDQPGMLGDAAFRDAGSALRREGQTFGQIAEAIERTGRPTSEYEDPVRRSEPLHEMPSEPGAPAWRRALDFVVRLVFSPLRRRIWLLAIALLVALPLYALRGFVAPGQQVSGYFDTVAAVRHSADQALSSVSSFIHERILGQSKEATAPPASPAPIPSAPAAAPPPPSATPPAAPPTASAPPATAPAPSASVSAPPAPPSAPPAPPSAPLAPPSAAPAPPSAAPAGPPVSTPRRDARGEPPAKSAADCAAAREDRYPCARRSTPFENDRPRALEDIIPERIRRKSHMAGPCIRGVGGCAWGGRQY